MLSIVFQVLYLLLYCLPADSARPVRVGRRAAVRPALAAGPGCGGRHWKSVWSVTDPPLKALRRVIPPLRLGTVSFDLASLVLLVILFVLMKFVVEPLITGALPG